MSSNLFFKYKIHLLVMLEFFIFFYLGNKLEFIISPILYIAVCFLIAFNYLKTFINVDVNFNS